MLRIRVIIFRGPRSLSLTFFHFLALYIAPVIASLLGSSQTCTHNTTLGGRLASSALAMRRGGSAESAKTRFVYCCLCDFVESKFRYLAPRRSEGLRVRAAQLAGFPPMLRAPASMLLTPRDLRLLPISIFPTLFTVNSFLSHRKYFISLPFGLFLIFLFSRYTNGQQFIIFTIISIQSFKNP